MRTRKVSRCTTYVLLRRRFGPPFFELCLDHWRGWSRGWRCRIIRFTWSVLSSKGTSSVQLVSKAQLEGSVLVHLNILAWEADSLSFCAGGVAVREDAPDSSPPLCSPDPKFFLPPLLPLRELNIAVGPNVAGPWLTCRAPPPLVVNLRKSSMPTVFFW